MEDGHGTSSHSQLTRCVSHPANWMLLFAMQKLLQALSTWRSARWGAISRLWIPKRSCSMFVFISSVVQVHPTGLVKPDGPRLQSQVLCSRSAPRSRSPRVWRTTGTVLAFEPGKRSYVTGEIWKHKLSFSLALFSTAHYSGEGPSPPSRPCHCDGAQRWAAAAVPAALVASQRGASQRP